MAIWFINDFRDQHELNNNCDWIIARIRNLNFRVARRERKEFWVRDESLETDRSVTVWKLVFVYNDKLYRAVAYIKEGELEANNDRFAEYHDQLEIREYGNDNVVCHKALVGVDIDNQISMFYDAYPAYPVHEQLVNVHYGYANYGYTSYNTNSEQVITVIICIVSTVLFIAFICFVIGCIIGFKVNRKNEQMQRDQV